MDSVTIVSPTSLSVLTATCCNHLCITNTAHLDLKGGFAVKPLLTSEGPAGRFVLVDKLVLHVLC